MMERTDDLTEMYDRAWALLLRGKADRRSGFHLIQVATIGADGAPRLRSVVLRGVDKAARALRFHTDMRAPKAAEITADARVAVHAYDTGVKIQIRLTGRATLHAEDETGDAAWAASSPSSRVCYRTPYPPGTAITAAGEADPDEAMKKPADAEAGREAFRAVTVAAETMDILHLAATGHRRAWFSAAEDWAGRWLAP